MASRKDIKPREKLNKQSLTAIGIAPLYQSKDFEDFDTYDKNTADIKAVLEQFVDNIHAMYEHKACLLMYGNNGSGKTFLMSILAKYCYKHYYRTFYGSFSEILKFTFNAYNLSDREAERKHIFDMAEFLFIDEIGKETDTKTGSNIALLEDTLKSAFTNGKCVILGSNLSPEDLEDRYGSTMGSLLDGYVKLHFKGKDYRREVLQESEVAKILGARHEKRKHK